MKIPDSIRPTSARDIATIRIKSETGKKTYLLKMKFNDTIGDLHKYIDKQRCVELMIAFKQGIE